MKSDHSIRNICIASVKRRTPKPFDFSFTCFFEKETLKEIDNEVLNFSPVSEHELPISRTLVDRNNWTFVTTRQIVSCVNGIVKAAPADKISIWDWGDFKGHNNVLFTVGTLQLDNDLPFEIFIETKRASMVTIYSIMTLVGLVKG